MRGFKRRGHVSPLILTCSARLILSHLNSRATIHGCPFIGLKLRFNCSASPPQGEKDTNLIDNSKSFTDLGKRRDRLVEMRFLVCRGHLHADARLAFRDHRERKADHVNTFF